MKEQSYSKQYYSKNRDKILAYQKDYYQRKKKVTNVFKVKYGKFVLFDDKNPCVVNWDSDSEEEEPS